MTVIKTGVITTALSLSPLPHTTFKFRYRRMPLSPLSPPHPIRKKKKNPAKHGSASPYYYTTLLRLALGECPNNVSYRRHTHLFIKYICTSKLTPLSVGHRCSFLKK